MSQVQTGQMMSLELLPLQVPEAVIDSATVFSRQAVMPQSLISKLCLRPGEFSELVVRIKNHSSESIQLNFSVTGDMPSSWWQLRTEGSSLPGHHQMEVVLYFAIAADFFEQPLAPEQLPLKLDYIGQLTVTAITSRGDSQEQISPFQVLIRPPSLYLDFLPDIYRNVDFVGRFLKIFETTFEPAVDILDHQWAYLDPLTAPQAMLPFLAHWVGWSFQGPLSLAQQRALIRYAMEIYRWRGTRRGLRFYLHLASGLPLDDHVSDESQRSIGIHENFSQGYVLGQTILGESTILRGNLPYHFNVQLRPPRDYPLDETLIRTIIEQEKPAFCSYALAIEPK
ncbi:phage tail protein [Leptolyngbyaceae cyanobacterium CCMR0082]|uniref:Phage tail protein n=1 Tax=Adonisia turfae CCMR0082 TaxID=2304604 RepID=A0A6M0SHV4_9CYAN|nr:phage tail protein [Adonisia turfae]NEZ67916.1 phage tail protein [Adonisia turfae CCMR0082]